MYRMAVSVLYFAELKEATKKDEESFALENSNVKELINLLFEKYNSLKNIIWDDNSKNLRSNVSIALNDTIVQNDDKLSLSLSSGDKIAFLLPMSGG